MYLIFLHIRIDRLYQATTDIKLISYNMHKLMVRLELWIHENGLSVSLSACYIELLDSFDAVLE